MIAGGTGLLSGCQQISDLLGITDPWAEYRDSTVNFISNLGFDKHNLIATDETLSTSWATWTWGWKTSSFADAATSNNYMTLSDVGTVSSLPSTVPAGLDATAHAYLLDIPNLLPKPDADFENLATPSSNWSLDADIGTPATPSTLEISNWPVRIDGNNSLLLNLNPKTGAKLALSALSDSIASTGQHAYRFMVKSSGLNLAYAFAPTGVDLISTQPQSLSNVFDIITDFSSNTNTTLLLGNLSSPISGALIDDLRVIRSDIASSYKLRILLRPSDTTPILTSGLWSFDVWVLLPPGRKQISDPAAVSPYASSVVTLSMDQIASPTNGFPEEFPIPSSAATMWTRLEFKMSIADYSNYQFDSNSTIPVIELSVWPTSQGHPDAEGILIAQPELHFWLNN